MPTVKPNIFDGETHRPMTDAEYAQWQADTTEAEAKTEGAIARQALLTKLGITEEEAQLLLGGN